ncbi:hypothetical protein C7N83_02115 [Neisseria iguanae]|uniref:Uncharacterized protein n=1 Tax=Neisseria iguanae TaxID=90242 RepID=A0A2P7U2D6_9NEIS|nr:hypothetical protein C7N83_02115 [Neisseria iguanae]
MGAVQNKGIGERAGISNKSQAFRKPGAEKSAKEGNLARVSGRLNGCVSDGLDENGLKFLLGKP